MTTNWWTIDGPIEIRLVDGRVITIPNGRIRMVGDPEEGRFWGDHDGIHRIDPDRIQQWKGEIDCQPDPAGNRWYERLGEAVHPSLYQPPTRLTLVPNLGVDYAVNLGTATVRDGITYIMDAEGVWHLGNSTDHQPIQITCREHHHVPHRGRGQHDPLHQRDLRRLALRGFHPHGHLHHRSPHRASPLRLGRGEPMSNHITIVGNLTRDPELRFTQSGQGVCSFSLAASRRFKKGDEWTEVTTFFNCTAWAQLGENIASSMSKGDRMIVQGYIEQSDWEDKEGTKRTSMDVKVGEAGAELRFATASIERTRRESSEDRKSGGGGGRQEYPEEPFAMPSTERDGWF